MHALVGQVSYRGSKPNYTTVINTKMIDDCKVTAICIV